MGIPHFQWEFHLCEEEHFYTEGFPGCLLLKEELTLKDFFFLDVNVPSKAQQDKFIKILGVTNYASDEISWNWGNCFNDKPIFSG